MGKKLSKSKQEYEIWISHMKSIKEPPEEILLEIEERKREIQRRYEQYATPRPNRISQKLPQEVMELQQGKSKNVLYNENSFHERAVSW